MVKKSDRGQVGKLPVFIEWKHRGTKTVPVKMLHLPGLNFACVHLKVDDVGITTECSDGAL